MLTNYIILHMTDYNPRSPYYMSQSISRVYDPEHCPSGGTLYYSYLYGVEDTYAWYSSSLSKTDFNGKSALIIRDYGDVITILNNDAFYSLPNSYIMLNEVMFNACSYIGHYAFNNCTYLRSVLIDKAEYIGAEAFRDCVNLPSLNLPLCSYIGREAFAFCYSLSNISLPLCKYISDNAFQLCSSLKYLSLPEVSYIGKNCFLGGGLTEITASKCETLGIGAFGTCANLEKIELNACKVIPDVCFNHCTHLISVSLPVCSFIGRDAFGNCYRLTDIYLGSTSIVQTNGGFGFWGMPKIHVPANLYNTYIKTYPYSDISTQIVGDL